MLTCRDAYALIVRTIDDDGLPADTSASLRGHLAACARCREEYETQYDVRRALALHIDEPPPAGFDARLSARLSRTAAPRPTHPTRPARARWRWGTWLIRIAMPIAATLLLIVGDTHTRGRDVAQPRADAAAGPGAAAAVTEVSTVATSPRRPRHRQSPRLPEPAMPTSPTSPESAASATDIIIAEADSLPDSLALTDEQRKQIEEINDQRRQTLTQILESTRKRVALERHQTDAAIERVLTPAQRRQYREQAADRERRASDGWTILPRASTSIPLPPTPSTPATPLPQPPF